MKTALLLTVVLLQFWMNECSIESQCQYWEHVPVTLKDLEGTWYIAAFVNETNEDEKSSCWKFNLKYHPENDSATEYTTGIARGTNELVIVNAELKMPTPGILNENFVQDSTSIEYHDYFVEFTRGESFITALCEIRNGTIYTDRLSLFFKQQHVTNQQIFKKLKSIGVKLGDNIDYYRIPQENCPN